MGDDTISATVDGGRIVAVRVTGAGSDELSSVALGNRVLDLNDAMEDMASLATTVRNHLERVAPTRATVEFGVGFTVSAGRLTALLVDAKADLAMKLTLEWDRTLSPEVG